MTIKLPSPKMMGLHQRALASLLEASFGRAEDMAGELAARGFPAATLGDGGSRGSATSTSTERAALGQVGASDEEGDKALDDRFVGVDVRLAKLARLLHVTSLQLQELIGDILAQAGTDDALPAGAGTCVVCEHMCRPDLDQNDRRRQGFCAGCYASWHRWCKRNKASRWRFIAWRRVQLDIQPPKPQAGVALDLEPGEAFHAG